jgi:predicted Zn-dependent peptidase
MEGLKSEFDFGLKKLKELLESPNYTEESMQKIVTQRVGMLMMTKSNFDYIASKNLKEILFKGTPLANPAYGTIESVKAITLKDIEKFLNSHLHLDNLIVIAGGDFQEDELKESLTKLLVAVPKGSVKPLAHIEPIKKPASKTLYEDTKQAYIYFGSPYFMEANSSKKVYGRVASFILGSSGFGSRLMEEIRVKRGLAYSAYSYFEVEKSYSYFTGYLQTKLESSKEAQDAVKEILKEFVEKGVTKEELEGAKKFFLGSEPLRTETLMKKLTRDFKEYYYGLGLGYHKKELQEIEKMKLEDLNEFIKSHKEIAELTFSIVTKK